MGGMAMITFEIERVQNRWRVATRALIFALASILTLSVAPVGAAEITLIHMGDVHGHLLPRPSIRGETTAKTEGGLARMYT